jgi:hypothetical protein
MTIRVRNTITSEIRAIFSGPIIKNNYLCFKIFEIILLE